MDVVRGRVSLLCDVQYCSQRLFVDALCGSAVGRVRFRKIVERQVMIEQTRLLCRILSARVESASAFLSR